MKRKWRGKARCLRTHVFINTDPNNSNKKRSPSQSLKCFTFGCELQRIYCFTSRTRVVSIFKNVLNVTTSYQNPEICTSEIHNMAMETHHDTEQSFLRAIVWEKKKYYISPVTFLSLSTARGAKNITLEWAYVLSILESLLPNICSY